MVGTDSLGVGGVRSGDGYRQRSHCSVAEYKARQSAKLRELAAVLATSGFVALDEQAKALGLSRSTAWTVLKGNHKASGLSAATITRMLSSPALPQGVRVTLLSYVEEKMAGLYGHNKMQLRRFAQCFFYYRSDHGAGPSKSSPTLALDEKSGAGRGEP
jgi:hypothetical protein